MTARNLRGIICGIAALWLGGSLLAQDKPGQKPKPGESKPQAAQPDARSGQKDQAKGDKPTGMEAEWEAWAALAAPNENHKMLEENFAGNWTFTCRMSYGPESEAPPSESTGTCTAKAILGGRFVQSEHTGEFQGEQFQGMGLIGYDNARQKFVNTWVDNMGTMVMLCYGTYDPSTKTLTFTGEIPNPMDPGKPMRVRYTWKIVSRDKHVMEWFETRDGKETKTMELTYTRKPQS